MRRRETFLFLGFVVLFLFAGAAYAYRPVIDLGTLGGYQSVAWSINDSGQIVGSAYNSSGDSRACLFDSTGGGKNKDLGTVGGSSYNTAYSINNNGQIVGDAGDGGYHDNSNSHACLFDSTGGGANKDLGVLSGGTTGGAYSINNNGQIVGWAVMNSYGYYHACLFDPTGGGNNIDLGVLSGTYSEALSINNNGQIVGWADSSSHYHRACLFDPTGGGNNRDLGTGGGTTSVAYSINDSGQIVGQADGRAYLFDSTSSSAGNSTRGANKDLGGIGSVAYSINNNGQIVGWAYNSSSSSLACLFDPTGQGNNIDLNTLIDPSCGWTLETAFSINNNGWIVGRGTMTTPDGMYEHAYLLIPEPASMLILGLGGILIALRRRRQ